MLALPLFEVVVIFQGAHLCFHHLQESLLLEPVHDAVQAILQRLVNNSGVGHLLLLASKLEFHHESVGHRLDGVHNYLFGVGADRVVLVDHLLVSFQNIFIDRPDSVLLVEINFVR